jgi:hypothetical protein
MIAVCSWLQLKRNHSVLKSSIWLGASSYRAGGGGGSGAGWVKELEETRRRNYILQTNNYRRTAETGLTL